LLIFSLGYAAWREWRTHHASGFATLSGIGAERSHPLGGRTLVVLAAGISLATILVRFVFPFDSGQIGNLKLWQWPSYLGMFGLGVTAVQRGGLDPVPPQIRRSCAPAVLLSLVVLGLVFAAVSLTGADTDVLKRTCIGRPPCSLHSKGRWSWACACSYSRSGSGI